ncbi:hypothetical protein ACFC5X_11655 [Streptomyces sp. NPDC055952]|uniref:hypothetical protein n=1 Tax=unclassified Streptomyces TaxID=2593676 RepID=UPI0035E1DFEB
MYEMCPGPDEPGTAMVWHVKAKQGTVTLCGRPLEPAEPDEVEADRHCTPCMTSFSRLVEQKS